MYGSYYVLYTLPIWATALILYVVTLGVLFVLRDRCEGLFYNTSYSAMIGDGALLVVVLMAAGILQRGGILLPEWIKREQFFHVAAAAIGICLGVIWLTLDKPKQWGDRYHHAVIAPLLCYLGITLVPVIYLNGTLAEWNSMIGLVLVWIVLVIYDARTHRLDQRRYRNLDKYLDAMKRCGYDDLAMLEWWKKN